MGSLSLDPVSQGLASLQAFKPFQSANTLLTAITDLFGFKSAKV
jgi:hypothetical protein